MKPIYLPGWEKFFAQEQTKTYFQALMVEVEVMYQTKIIFPTKANIFRIFNLIEPNEIKVVIIGQDPYHKAYQADGIAFSSTNQVLTPPSLRNLFKELLVDLRIDHFDNNDLSGWVKQGIFLINTIFTVEQNQPLSHANKGWEIFSSNCLKYLITQNEELVFCLLGKNALKVFDSLNYSKSKAIITGHPSPLSYKKHFENSKIFSKINQMLEIEVDWTK